MNNPRKVQATLHPVRPWGDIHMVIRKRECSVDLTEDKPGPKNRFWAEDRIFKMLVVNFGEWKAEDQIKHEDDYGRQSEPSKL